LSSQGGEGLTISVSCEFLAVVVGGGNIMFVAAGKATTSGCQIFSVSLFPLCHPWLETFNLACTFQQGRYLPIPRKLMLNSN